MVKEALRYVAAEENIEAFDKPVEFAQKIQELANASHGNHALGQEKTIMNT